MIKVLEKYIYYFPGLGDGWAPAIVDSEAELEFIREGQRGFSASMSYFSGGSSDRSYYIGGFTDIAAMTNIQLSDYYGATEGGTTLSFTEEF